MVPEARRSCSLNACRRVSTILALAGDPAFAYCCPASFDTQGAGSMRTRSDVGARRSAADEQKRGSQLPVAPYPVRVMKFWPVLPARVGAFFSPGRHAGRGFTAIITRRLRRAASGRALYVGRRESHARANRGCEDANAAAAGPAALGRPGRNRRAAIRPTGSNPRSTRKCGSWVSRPTRTGYQGCAESNFCGVRAKPLRL